MQAVFVIQRLLFKLCHLIHVSIKIEKHHVKLSVFSLKCHYFGSIYPRDFSDALHRSAMFVLEHEKWHVIICGIAGIYEGRLKSSEPDQEAGAIEP